MNGMKEDLRDAIWALRDEDDRIFPEKLVVAARDPKHPAHTEFDWNDARLANKARLEKAQKLINMVRIRYTMETEVHVVKAFVQDPVVVGSHRSSIAMKSDIDAAKESLSAYLRNTRGDLRAAHGLAVLWGFGEAHIVQALEAVEALLTELEPAKQSVPVEVAQPRSLELV
jgi:hypothetical protein